MEDHLTTVPLIPEYCRYDRAAAYDKASLDRIQKPPEKKVNKFFKGSDRLCKLGS